MQEAIKTGNMKRTTK